MMERRGLSGRAAVETGASRGAGRGIAFELGAAGATVYVYVRMMPMNNTLLRSSTVVVLVHALLTLLHGIAHAAEQATLPAAANAFVAIVIVAAPLVALGLLWSRLRWLGGLLLLASMLAALLFGIVFHYMLPGTDHVAQIPAGPWQLPFQLTTGLLALSEAVGAAVGGWILYRLRRAPSDTGIRA